MSSSFVSLVCKALVLFMFGMFFGMSLGCSQKEPDPVALNTPITSEQQKALDDGKKEEAKYGFKPSSPTWGDSATLRYHEAKNFVDKAAVTTGQFIGTVIFHILLWAVPFLIIIFIPGFIAGRAEMVVEGVLLIVAGIGLLLGSWVGELGLTHWVWICMILPGAVLIIATLFTKEGPWKLAVVFGGQTVMTMLAVFGLINSAMSALIHGSLLALAVVGLILYGVFSGGDEKPAEAHG